MGGLPPGIASPCGAQQHNGVGSLSSVDTNEGQLLHTDETLSPELPLYCGPSQGGGGGSGPSGPDTVRCKSLIFFCCRSCALFFWHKLCVEKKLENAMAHDVLQTKYTIFSYATYTKKYVSYAFLLRGLPPPKRTRDLPPENKYTRPTPKNNNEHHQGFFVFRRFMRPFSVLLCVGTPRRQGFAFCRLDTKCAAWSQF